MDKDAETQARCPAQVYTAPKGRTRISTQEDGSTVHAPNGSVRTKVRRLLFTNLSHCPQFCWAAHKLFQKVQWQSMQVTTLQRTINFWEVQIKYIYSSSWLCHEVISSDGKFGKRSELKDPCVVTWIYWEDIKLLHLITALACKLTQ